MQWIAPSEKDTATDTLEKRLWDAADQFRANSGLTRRNTPPHPRPDLPALCRGALCRRAREAGEEASSSRRGSRVDEPAAYHAEGILYLTPKARFDYLLHLPEGSNAGKAVNAAMRDIEKHNPQLAGVLPKTYNLFTGTLLKELLKKVSEIPGHASTTTPSAASTNTSSASSPAPRARRAASSTRPASIVRLLAEVIEPFHGRILDPACGSGGMFVQSARFVAEHQKNPAAELSIYGVEKTDETGRLCRLNLAVHGLEGDIRHGGNVNSYYDDPHNATGQFDFVLANPPFNVNAVDKERLEGHGRPRPPLPLRPAAHRQRQLPLDSALLLRAERQGPRRLRHGQLRLRRPLLRAGTPAASSSKRAPWT